MNSPHLRRRYRAAGARSGLVYLLAVVAAASLYVAQHVYTVREQCKVEALRRDVEDARGAVEQLTFTRDGRLGLQAMQARAAELGLGAPDLTQMASLPLDAPILDVPPRPAEPPLFVQTFRRMFHGLDAPGISPTEAQAGE